MRILFLSNVFPNEVQPQKGTFNQQMVQSLAEQHLVRVISPVSWLDECSARWKKGQRLNRGDQQQSNGVLVDYPRFYYPPKILRSAYDKFLWHSMKSEASRVMNSFRPDLILSYWVHPDGTVAVKLGREFDVPVVTITGGSDVLLLGRSGSRRKAILKTLHDANHVLTVGEHLREQLLRDGLPDGKVQSISRGVNTDKFSPGDQFLAKKELGLPGKIPILISVGRLVPVKAHQNLIAACAKLMDQGQRFRCYLIGDGPLKGLLNEQIQQARLENVIDCVGSQNQSQLANWYRAADLTVLPSLSEGVPNVLLESLACGTPFVASNVGGIPEIADPVHDALVPADDPMALANAIREKLVQAPPATVRNWQPFSHEESAEQLSAILQSVVTEFSSCTAVPELV